MKYEIGKFHLHRGFCGHCEDSGFADDDGCCVDCGNEMEFEKGRKRISESKSRRKKPSPDKQYELLDQQDNCCFWCGWEFGTEAISPAGKVYHLRVNWDHFVPYVYTGSCDDLEFVAACHVCNAIKSSKMFDTEEECRGHIRKRLKEKGWQYVG